MTDEPTKDAEAIEASRAFARVCFEYDPVRARAFDDLTGRDRDFALKSMRAALDAAISYRRAQPASGLAEDARKIVGALLAIADCATPDIPDADFQRRARYDLQEIARSVVFLAEALAGKIEDLQYKVDYWKRVLHDEARAAGLSQEVELATVTKERDDARKWAEDVERTNKETIDHAKGFVERSNAARLAAEAQLAAMTKERDELASKDQAWTIATANLIKKRDDAVARLNTRLDDEIAAEYARGIEDAAKAVFSPISPRPRMRERRRKDS